MPRFRDDPALWITTLVVLAVHLAVAGRYDFFRNELYFIICGRHPDWGYVDQPPLVPLLSAATQLFGENLFLLRLPVALAAAAMVPLTAALCRQAGGGRGAALFAAVAASIAPMLLGMSTIVTTSSFEPLTWTLVAYGLARAAIGGDRRALLWTGLAIGLSMQAKYGIPIWLAGLGLGVLATPARRILAWRETWLGGAIAVLVAMPSLIWQALHGWPFFAVIGHATLGGTNLTGGPIHFIIVQIVAVNPVLAILALTGAAAPFLSARLAPARFLAIGFVVAAALVIAAHGKDYYLFPAYPALFAVGAAGSERLGPLWRGIWLAGAVALSALALPVVLPILDPPALAAYLDRTHLHPIPEEKAAIGAPLTQIFSDELGWRALEKQVVAVYAALPPEDRAKAAIVASNYGEAAAIDFYGVADGLPPALGGQNQYWLWGPRGYDGSVMIHVGGDAERWQQACDSAEIAGNFGAPYVMPYENDRPIVVCRGLKRPLDEVWDRFKRFQ